LLDLEDKLEAERTIAKKAAAELKELKAKLNEKDGVLRYLPGSLAASLDRILCPHKRDLQGPRSLTFSVCEPRKLERFAVYGPFPESDAVGAGAKELKSIHSGGKWFCCRDGRNLDTLIILCPEPG
jgi:hypothetical protein